jgi:hypothetical protein
MKNEIVMDQLILFYKLNKKVRSEVIMDYLILQTKHAIIGSKVCQQEQGEAHRRTQARLMRRSKRMAGRSVQSGSVNSKPSILGQAALSLDDLQELECCLCTHRTSGIRNDTYLALETYDDIRRCPRLLHHAPF